MKFYKSIQSNKRSKIASYKEIVNGSFVKGSCNAESLMNIILDPRDEDESIKNFVLISSNFHLKQIFLNRVFLNANILRSKYPKLCYPSFSIVSQNFYLVRKEKIRIKKINERDEEDGKLDREEEGKRKRSPMFFSIQDWTRGGKREKGREKRGMKITLAPLQLLLLLA